MRLNDMPVRLKLVGAFIILACAVGYMGWNGFSSAMEVKRVSTVVNSALEMEIAIRGDMQMIMELLAAENRNDLDARWEEHIEFVRQYDTFQSAIFDGAEAEGETLYATDDEQVRAEMKRADAIHNDQFVPAIGKIYSLRKDLLSGQETEGTSALLDEIDTNADETGNRLMELLGEVENRAKDEMTTVVRYVKLQALFVTGVVALLAVGGGFILAVKITAPLNKAVDFATRMGDGDLTQSLVISQKDEVGVLADALNNMKDNLSTMFRDIIAGVNTLSAASAELSAISNQMAASSEQTTGKVNTVATAAEEMSANMDSVAAASEETSVNVNMVSAAAEEMSTTILEISSNTDKTRSITDEAVTQSKNASLQINELGTAAHEIGQVTETITEISEQTNLLALNATIEAARAGDAGKGFAVVANEIKDLAKQTSEATSEIKEKITKIQNATKTSVTEITQITGIITEASEMVSTVSITVQEQTKATQEIADNVSQASLGIQEVNENVAQASSVTAEIAADITDVSVSSNEINESSILVKKSAQKMSELAGSLENMISRFQV